MSQTHFSPIESWRAGGTYDWEFRVRNPTRSPVEVASLTKLLRGVGYSKLDSAAVAGTAEKCLDVRFGGTVEPGGGKAFYHRETAMWPGTVNTLDIDVRKPGSDVPFLRRAISWDVEKGLRWKDEKGLPSLDSAFYPSKGNRLRARFRANGVKDLVKGGVIVVGPGGRRFFERRYSGSPYLKGESIDTQLGDLPLGDYVVKFAAVDSKGAKYTDEKTFSVAKFPWQGLNLGKERIIVPPFRPLVVKDDREVHALQTGFRCGGMLWDEVYAKGENILAGPVEFRLNGRGFTVVSAKFTERSQDRVVRELEAKLDDIRLFVRQEYDYDGFCDVNFRFVPGKPVNVESLVLVAPLKGKYVSLFNETVRAGNKRGLAAPDFALPTGEGVVWSSDRGTPPSWIIDHYGAWVSPYVWLGGPEKGFCWLIDSIRDMSLERRSAPQRIVRRGDTVAFESFYVNKPVVWDGEKSFRAGFQPSPVKPQEKRYYGFASHMHAYLCPSNAVGYTLSPGSMPKMWPLVYPNNLYPGGDFSLMDFLIKSRKVDKPLFNRMVNEYSERHRKWFEECSHDTVESFRDSMRIRWRLMGCEYTVDYMNPWIHSCHWPEWEMYKAEWTRFKWPVENEVNEYHSKDCESRVDKLLYDAKFSLDHGMKGIYYDCFEQARDYNYVMSTGGAYLRKDGDVQISCNDLFAWRDFVKRTAHLCWRNGGVIYGRPFVEIHATSFQIVPVMSFATSALLFERGGDGGDYQDRFPEPYLLTDVFCRQTGAVPRFIVSTRRGDMARKQRELKTLFALMCACGVFALEDQSIVYADWFDKAWNIVYDAGWGKADAEMHWYHDGLPQPVVHDGRDVRVTSVKRGGSALVMFGNLGEEADVKFDVSGLGLGDAALSDAETGEAVSAGRLHIGRHGYRLVRVGGKAGRR